MNPISSHTDTGKVIVGYTSTSDQAESWRWSRPTMRDSDRKSRLGGTRYTRKIATPIHPPHDRLSRESAYAAGNPSTSVMATTNAPTHSVFHTNVGNAVFVQR